MGQGVSDRGTFFSVPLMPNRDPAAPSSTVLVAVDVGIAVDISSAGIIWYHRHVVAVVVV